MTTTWAGVPRPDLTTILRDGVDHGGDAVEPFTDPDGGWWLRCCLSHSRPGDALAVIGFSAFPWRGPYRETGPVAVHTDLEGRCPGHDGSFPAVLERKRRVVRAFGDDGGRVRTQVYGLHRLLEAGEGLQAYVERVLDDARVERVHLHDAVSQCFTVAATRR